MAIARKPLAMQPLATFVREQAVDIWPIHFEGAFTSMHQSNVINHEGAFVSLEQQNIFQINFQGAFAGIEQNNVLNFEGAFTSLAQENTSTAPVDENKAFPFIGYGDFGRFGLQIEFDGSGKIDDCRLLDSIVITHEEGNASQCDLNLRVDDGLPVDLHQYLNQNLRVWLTRPDAAPVLAFEGVVDSGSWPMSNIMTQWKAIVPRKRLINALSDAQVAGIGYHNELVFKKLADYTEKSQQVEDRLSTIPSALDFIDGRPVVTSWFPKATPDLTINECKIETTSVANSVWSQERIVNIVEVTVQLQWDALWHVERPYSFVADWNVCNSSIWGNPPSNDSIKNAVRGAGWVLSNYQSVGLPDNGIYRCRLGGYPKQVWYNPRAGTFSPANDNDPESRDERSIVNVQNVYATQAWFTASIRYAQPVEERLLLEFRNEASVSRYGERKAAMSVTVSQDREDATDRSIKRWEHYQAYERPQKVGAVKQSNGYWLKRADNIKPGILQSAVDVTSRAAQVKMLESHRSVEYRHTLFEIAPQLDVTQTHAFNTPQAIGKLKVHSVKHVLNLVFPESSETQVSYRAFSNAANETYNFAPVQPVRAALNLASNPTYNSKLESHNIGLNDVVFHDEDEYEAWLEQQGPFRPNAFLYWNANGSITETTKVVAGDEYRQEVEFQFIADEIEEESTDTMEIKATTKVLVPIPNDDLELIA